MIGGGGGGGHHVCFKIGQIFLQVIFVYRFYL